MFKTLRNNLKFFKNISAVLKVMKGQEPDTTRLITDDIEDTVDRLADKPAIIFEGASLTFREFDARANRFAQWALGQGLQPGHAVALVMENCPDYPTIWYGLSKVGVVTALINSNLEGKGLAHCINIADCKAVIANGKQAEAVQAIAPDLAEGIKAWDLDGRFGENLEAALNDVPCTRPSRDHRTHLRGKDTMLFIYTSGTTGLPKAARIPHMRMARSARMPVAMCGLSEEDIVYNVLPLYHITGGGLGMGGALLVGATTVLRRGFSASGFWTDASDYKPTVFFYVGELCRYLVNTEEHPLERAHRFRAGVGNGMRGEVWKALVDRFGISSMHELYGSTEGNVAFLNLDGAVGAVGQLPPFFEKMFGATFVKFDVEMEMPVRNSKGRCIKAAPGEVGEAIGRIKETGMNAFEGYHDKKETNSKILRDVFQPGDAWFRTGDLMKRDDLGYIYFIDRIGDTFRWKGENVATNEVADVMSAFHGIETANVYGVPVTGCEGKAGMAALTVSGELDFTALHDYLQANLPPYAVPLFLRIQGEASVTGNFKFQKVTVQKEGFDINRLSDDIWFRCPQTKAYIPLDAGIYERIQKTDIKL
jgi:fatty-acyl-CoA synthase